MRSVRDDGSGLIGVQVREILLVGATARSRPVPAAPRSDTRGVFSSRGPEGARAIGDVAQFVVHDINNLLAVIGSGLRLLECQSDAAYRKVIVGKMQEAITRGALLSRQFLDAARPRPKSIDGFVAGSRLAAIAGTLDWALRPDITVRTEIAPDLWAFNADPEELYFALLDLCRNSADAMPDGGVITVAARNVEPPPGTARGSVENVVADGGEGMPEEVLRGAFTPYHDKGRSGTAWLTQVQRFAEGTRAVGIESEQGAGTLVRLFLPRVRAVGSPAVSPARRSPTRRHPTAAYSTSSPQRHPRPHRRGRERLETGSALELMIPPGRLDRPVDHETDHVLGPADAEITLVEYGSYACPHCRAANERIAQARDQLGERVCYAFRHRPLTDNSLAFRAAVLAELAQTPEAFWSAHIKLMTRSMQLTEDDLVAVAADLGVNADFALGDGDAVRSARARVEADVASSAPAAWVHTHLLHQPPAL